MSGNYSKSWSKRNPIQGFRGPKYIAQNASMICSMLISILCLRTLPANYHFLYYLAVFFVLFQLVEVSAYNARFNGADSAGSQYESHLDQLVAERILEEMSETKVKRVNRRDRWVACLKLFMAIATSCFIGAAVYNTYTKILGVHALVEKILGIQSIQIFSWSCSLAFVVTLLYTVSQFFSRMFNGIDSNNSLIDLVQAWFNPQKNRDAIVNDLKVKIECSVQKGDLPKKIQDKIDHIIENEWIVMNGYVKWSAEHERMIDLYVLLYKGCIEGSESGDQRYYPRQNQLKKKGDLEAVWQQFKKKPNGTYTKDNQGIISRFLKDAWQDVTRHHGKRSTLYIPLSVIAMLGTVFLFVGNHDIGLFTHAMANSHLMLAMAVSASAFALYFIMAMYHRLKSSEGTSNPIFKFLHCLKDQHDKSIEPALFTTPYGFSAMSLVLWLSGVLGAVALGMHFTHYFECSVILQVASTIAVVACMAWLVFEGIIAYHRKQYIISSTLESSHAEAKTSQDFSTHKENALAWGITPSSYCYNNSEIELISPSVAA